MGFRRVLDRPTCHPEKRLSGRGLCHACYEYRRKRNQLPPMPDPVALFWALVDKNGPVHPVIGTNCWDWVGPTSRDATGHRRGWFGRVKAYRYSWALDNGPIPDGFHVCHHCDRPICIRSDHLFLGTPADNMADMVAKGRSRAILTPQTIEEIRSWYETGLLNQPALADKYGVSQATVWHALQRSNIPPRLNTTDRDDEFWAHASDVG
jgi:HNH endonuclease